MMAAHARARPLTMAAATPFELANRAFPALTLAAALFGLYFPARCAALGTARAFSVGLSLLIFSMGLTLTPDDLARATRAPLPMACNLFCCFVLTPLVALALASLLGPELGAGAVLLGCVSGGQASNLFALLARGDVALSVVLTLGSTLGARGTPPRPCPWQSPVSTPVMLPLVMRRSLTLAAAGCAARHTRRGARLTALRSPPTHTNQYQEE